MFRIHWSIAIYREDHLRVLQTKQKSTEIYISTHALCCCLIIWHHLLCFFFVFFVFFVFILWQPSVHFSLTVYWCKQTINNKHIFFLCCCCCYYCWWCTAEMWCLKYCVDMWQLLFVENKEKQPKILKLCEEKTKKKKKKNAEENTMCCAFFMLLVL